MPCDDERPVRVLFIVGMARSGSTLLTVLLNEVEGLTGLGEAHVYWDLVGHGRECGCGCDLDDDCPIWGALRRVHEEQGLDLAEMRQSFHDFVRPRPRSLLRRIRVRRGGTDAARLARYSKTMDGTYRWLTEHTGARLLIDSTKLPAAADLITAQEDTEVHIVHLVRDPRAVAHSLGRRRLRGGGQSPGVGAFLYFGAVLRAAIDWTLRNAYVELRLRGPSSQYARLRFEDLTQDPRRAVAMLLEMAGMDPPDDLFVEENVIESGENHILTGDESRFKRGRIEIAPQESWREEMPGYARLAVTIIALPLLRTFSYALLPRRRAAGRRG